MVVLGFRPGKVSTTLTPSLSLTLDKFWCVY